MTWHIIDKTRPALKWDNEFGWCGTPFTVFTQTERESLTLPMNGKWIAAFSVTD